MNARLFDPDDPETPDLVIAREGMARLCGALVAAGLAEEEVGRAAFEAMLSIASRSAHRDQWLARLTAGTAVISRRRKMTEN